MSSVSSTCPPGEHRSFYARSRYTLNVTRADMVRAGFQPERPAVRSGGLRHADHLRYLARARHHLGSWPGDRAGRHGRRRDSGLARPRRSSPFGDRGCGTLPHPQSAYGSSSGPRASRESCEPLCSGVGSSMAAGSLTWSTCTPATKPAVYKVVQTPPAADDRMAASMNARPFTPVLHGPGTQPRAAAAGRFVRRRSPSATSE